MNDDNLHDNINTNENTNSRFHFDQNEYQDEYQNSYEEPTYYSTYKEPSTGNLLMRLFYSYAKDMPVTYIIIIANIIAYIMCLFSDNDSFHTGGVNYDYIIINKEYIRFISHMFLHGNLMHIGNNMVMLWLFGSKVEPRVGSFKMFITYAGSGIAGGILSMYMHHKVDPVRMTYSAGASGAIYGIMIATFVLHLRNQENKRRDEALRNIAYLGVFFFLSMKNSEGVDTWSHLGGAIAGGLIMCFLTAISRIEEEEESIFKTLGIILTVAFCIAGVAGADIGKEASELPDERVDFMKEQTVDGSNYITYGDVFDYTFSEGKWEGFTSTGGEQVVEFIGKTYYKNKEVEVHFQFVLNKTYTEYEISYFGVDGEPGTYKGYDLFMDYIRDRYEKGTKNRVS